MQVDFPNPLTAPDDLDLIAIGQFDIDGNAIALTTEEDWPQQTVVGSNWNSEVILAAYRKGLFPMPLDAKNNPRVISWWSPNPRGVLELADLKISRSLKKSMQAFRVTVDQEFEKVMRNCGDPSRPSGWITAEVIDAYVELHHQGYAHSIEVWDKSGQLAGGLYGLEIGGLFAGESMFHHQPDASKVALAYLVTALDDGSDRLIDCQWQTEHLASLGVHEISREKYLARLPKLLQNKPRL